uniref:Small nuclear ribonucleoprotein E n=1 Tax=Bos mutus grunniens TaxID=30521 RepID=A0A8B9X296_BOSMU
MIPWRRAWQRTPVFLLGGSIPWIEEAGYSPWDCKESDTTYAFLVIRCETWKTETLEKTVLQLEFALRSRIQVWLYEQVNMRIEGCIIGFDEYMNLVLDDAEEIHSKTKSRKQLGRIMLKGDNITLLQSVSN